MDKHSLKRPRNLYSSVTPISISALRTLVNSTVNNSEVGLTREELRQLLNLMLDSITNIITGGGNFITVSITAPSGIVAIAANRHIDVIIIRSAATQLVSIGRTLGGIEFVEDMEITAGVDLAYIINGWYGVAGSLHITCTNNLTLQYHLV